MTAEQPPDKRRSILLIIALVTILSGVLLVVARGIVRETIVLPLLYALWSLIYILDGIPQGLIWLGLIMLTIFLALRSLWDTSQSQLGPSTREDNGATVSGWQRLLAHARHDQYARWRTAQRLVLLAAEQLAQRDNLGLRQARQKIEAGLPDMPAQLHAYFRAGLAANRPDQRLRTRLRRSQHDPLDLDPAVALDYLENMMR